MDTSAIFDFIDNFVYTYDKGDGFIDALYFGEMSFDDFAKMASQKRKAFDACVFQCTENERTFHSLGMIYERIVSIANQYKRFPYWEDYGEYNIAKLSDRELCKAKYHKIRGKEIVLAVASLEKLLKINGQTLVDNIYVEDEVINETFSANYNDEQLQSIYDYLIENDYLHQDTKLNDFIYYFSGRGDVAVTPLRWIGSSTDLALFVKNFYPNEDKVWIKTTAIFGKKARYATLANSATFSKRDKEFSRFQNGMKSILKK